MIPRSLSTLSVSKTCSFFASSSLLSLFACDGGIVPVISSIRSAKVPRKQQQRKYEIRQENFLASCEGHLKILTLSMINMSYYSKVPYPRRWIQAQIYGTLRAARQITLKSARAPDLYRIRQQLTFAFRRGAYVEKALFDRVLELNEESGVGSSREQEQSDSSSRHEEAGVDRRAFLRCVTRLAALLLAEDVPASIVEGKTGATFATCDFGRQQILFLARDFFSLRQSSIRRRDPFHRGILHRYSFGL